MTFKHFPQDLLNSPIEDKVEYFEQDVSVSHPNLTDAYTNLEKLVKANSNKGSLILLMGPPGVGKTHLISKFYEDYIHKNEEAMSEDPGLIPIIKVNAPSPETGKFDWKALYRRLLKAGEEPLINSKVKQEYDPETKKLIQRKRGSVSNYKESLINVIKYRKVKLIIIDETQHLGKVKSAEQHANQLDVLKDIVNESEVTIVMVGNYNLRSFTSASAQLSRRIKEIVIYRYRENPTDYQKFANTLNSFLKRMPIENGLEFSEEVVMFFYERCGGLIGILKDLLDSGYSSYLQRGSKKDIALKDFEEFVMKPEALKMLLSEIRQDEHQLLNDNKSKYSNLYSFEHQDKGSKKKGNKKPGQRNPVRDNVDGV
ncbi:TniB family NTP-binding protein [Alkalibacillus sp. S2W]|uniref:TniB family NTP-binding protein n=1 Tax=Alkalibacillus sp. S2W TaxID=3386553 RepID=UPI00398CFD6A